MIWELVKRDPAWKMMPYFAAASPLIWPFGSDEPSQTFASIGAMLPIAIVGYSRAFPQRYPPLLTTLPIAGRQLLFARVAALMGFIWLPILSALAAVAVGGHPWTWSDPLPLLLSGAVITLALMLIQTVQVGNINPPAGLTHIAFVAMVISGPIAMTAQFRPNSFPLTIAVLGGCVLASAALFLKAWMEVPKCFQLAPNQLGVGESIPTWTGPAVRQHSTARDTNTTRTNPSPRVLRGFYLGSQTWGFLFFIAFPPLSFGWGLMPFAFFAYCQKLRWLLPLPISTRKLLWVVWGPTTVIILVSLLVNAGVESRAVSKLPELGPIWNLQLPAGFWRWAPTGTAPAIKAPWGERHLPETKGRSPLAFYNPYSAGVENRQRFVEWQFLRATQAVYGQPIPLLRISDLSRKKTTLQQPRSLVIFAAVALLVYLIQMCVIHLSGWKRLRYAGRGLRSWIALAPILVGWLLILGLPYFGDGNYLREAMVLHLGMVLPGNVWLLALTALVPMAGLHWLAEKLWRENEFGQIDLLTRQPSEVVS